MSLSFMMNFAALLVIGVHEATLIAAAGAWSQSTFNVRQKNPLYRTLFNVAAVAISVAATGWMYVYSGGASAASLMAPEELMALTAAVATHFLVNSGLVAGAIALSAKQSFVKVWTDYFVSGWLNQLLGAVIAVVLARGIHQTRFWLVPVTSLLVYLTYRTYRTYHAKLEAEQQAVQQVSDLHEATLEALALAIDAKDKDSRTHMRRLQAFCVTLARAEGLGDEEVQAIKTAALLHDIGMLAVPQHILSKTARLSEEERRKLRIHPQVGADIIRDVPFPSPVAPIILAHHERWDGGGYPVGLKWEAIPLGARILAIADHFDELLSSRDIGGFDEAVCILRGEAGHALDPHLVTRFISLLPKLSDVIASGAPTALERAGVGLAPPMARAKASEATASRHASTTRGMTARGRRHRQHRQRRRRRRRTGSACRRLADAGVESVRQHRAGAPRGLHALRTGAGAERMSEHPGRDGSTHRAPRQARAAQYLRVVPAGRQPPSGRLPLRHRSGRADAAADARADRRGTDRLGRGTRASAGQRVAHA